MKTIDLRTRADRAEPPTTPAAFTADEAPELADRHGDTAARGLLHLGLTSLTLVVEDECLTFATSGDRLQVRDGGGGDLVVDLGIGAFNDLIRDVTSTFALHLQQECTVRQGTAGALIRWEPVLRSFLDGRPVHEPGMFDLVDRDGAELDLTRAFTLDDDPDDIAHFLTQAGYLHLSGVFTDEEMAAVSADIDAAMAAATRDDGSSWWARTQDDGWYPSRILGFNHRSPALRELLDDPRFLQVGRFTDDTMRRRDPAVEDAAEALHKRVGVVEGISDVTWHKDCSMGGHSRRCCGLTLGISVTGAGPTTGELAVIAGSHRANIVPVGDDRVVLPRVSLPTRTGDVTVHCSCTVHMSRPPTAAERRVVYTGFGLAPRDGDEQGAPASSDEDRAARAGLNDHGRRLQNETR